jgi:putative SOS response-associated peptidase YedK
MCANFRPVRRDQTHLLQLPEPTEYDFSSDIYPLNHSPLIFAGPQGIEWRSVKFGMIPQWARDLKIGRMTYNARTETVHEKPSFKHAWYHNQFALIPVQIIYEPKYVNGKAQRWGIYRKDGLPFTVAAIYENTLLQGQHIRSMSMLTINAEQHPLMQQFHKPGDEKRSIIVIPGQAREDWLHCNFEDAVEFFLNLDPAEFTASFMPRKT